MHDEHQQIPGVTDFELEVPAEPSTDGSVVKYTLQGNEIRVIAETPAGVLVCGVYDDPSDEGVLVDRGRPFLVEKVYDKPPTEILDKQVAELEKQIKNLHTERTSLAIEKRELEVSLIEIRRRCQDIEPLRHIFDFIDGKITHYVFCKWDNTVSIIPFGDTKVEDARNVFKLLSLFGQSHGVLTWNLNRYSDGSGSYDLVYPATSEEQAQKIAREVIAKRLEESPRQEVLECAEQFGVPIPAGYRETLVEQRKKYLQKEIERNRDQLAKREKELAALATPPPSGGIPIYQ